MIDSNTNQNLVNLLQVVMEQEPWQQQMQPSTFPLSFILSGCIAYYTFHYHLLVFLVVNGVPMFVLENEKDSVTNLRWETLHFL